MIGENPGARNRQWNGGIDDVAIWRRALTAEQIQAIYLAGTNGQSLGDLIGGSGIDPLGLAVSLAADDPLTIRAEFNTQPARQYDILVSQTSTRLGTHGLSLRDIRTSLLTSPVEPVLSLLLLLMESASSQCAKKASQPSLRKTSKLETADGPQW